MSIGRVIVNAVVFWVGFITVTSFAAEKQNGNGRGAWSVKAPLPRTNSEFGVAELAGKIYVMGGYPADRKTVPEVQVYDSKTDKWQIIAPLPLALNHIMPAAANGKIYVIGGQTTESSEPDKAGFVNTVYEYDPAIGKWSARAPMPTMRGGGVAAVVDGKIYVAGGRPPRGHDFAVYDPNADKWTTLPNLPTQRNHLAAGAHDGKIYVFGGRFEGGFRSKTTDAVEVYDPKTMHGRQKNRCSNRVAVSTASLPTVASICLVAKAIRTILTVFFRITTTIIRLRIAGIL